MKLSLKCTLSSSSSSFSLSEQEKYAFPMSRFICIKQLKQSSCSYIPLPENVDYILQLKCLVQRKSIAVIQKLRDNNHCLSIYSLKGERKSIKLHINPSSVQIASADNDLNVLYCMLTFHEGTKIIQADLNKMKITAQAFLSEQINQIQASASQRDVISICGNGVLKLYQTKEEGFEQQLDLFKRCEGKQFVCQIWFDSTIFIACTHNEIYYFRDNQLIKTIPNCFATPIKHICKMNKYFIIAAEKEVGIFTRGDDDVQLYEKSEIPQSITGMQANLQEDQLVLRLSDLSFAFSNLNINNDFENANQKITLFKWSFRPAIGPVSFDSVSICQNKSLALFINRQQQTISIWNLETETCILKKQFSTNADNANSGLVCGDIHPNGYSICLAFGDRIRLYHLTVEDITLYQEISCRRIKCLKFSHGGHLLGYISGKSKNSIVGIFNVFTGKQVMTTKINADLQLLCWSFGDSQLATSGQNNIYLWKGALGFKQREDIYLQSKVNSISFDYKSGKLLASASGQLYEIQASNKVANIPVSIPKFYSMLSNSNKYVATDYFGNLYVDTDISFNKSQKLSLSNSKAIIFNYMNHVIYLSQNNNELSVLRSRQQPKFRQEDFTLITRSQIVKNREKLRTLQQLIETYQTQLMARLQHERAKFKEIKLEQQKVFSKEAVLLQQQYSNLTTEKLHIQKISGHLFKTVEEKQLKAVQTLEVLYEQKLAMERKKIMDLQQKVLEQNVYFERTIEQTTNKHQKQLEKLKRELQNNSNRQDVEYKVKQKEQQLKSEYDLRLKELQLQNQHFVQSMQTTANGSISDLYSEISLLKRKYNTSQVQNESMRQQVDTMKEEIDNKSDKLNLANQKISECKNKIASLEKEVNWKDELIKDKENKLYQYQFRIADLEKSKQVLNFRTTEIWRELQPKQSEVDRLKKKLEKLDNDFKKSEKENVLTAQKLRKSQTLMDHLKKDILDVKHKLKLKNAQYEELALQIHRLVNDVQPRARGSQILKVYQDLKFKKPQGEHKSQDQKTNQLNRHLIFVEQSLHQVNISNKKHMNNRQVEIIRKMKENAELITDLNDLRKRQQQYKSDIALKDTELSRLKRELTELTKTTSKKAISEHTGFTSMPGTSSRKRNIKSSQIPMRQVDSLQTSFRMDHKVQYSTMRTRQTRIMSANKTAIVHRAMNESHAQRTQTNEMAHELEVANRRIQQQDRIIDQLNRRLMNDIPE